MDIAALIRTKKKGEEMKWKETMHIPTVESTTELFRHQRDANYNWIKTTRTRLSISGGIDSNDDVKVDIKETFFEELGELINTKWKL